MNSCAPPDIAPARDLLAAVDRFLESVAAAPVRPPALDAISRRLSIALGKAFSALGTRFVQLLQDESSWWIYGWEGHYHQAAMEKRSLFTGPLTDAARRAIETGAAEVIRLVGVDMELRGTDSRVLDYLRTRIRQSVDSILETTRGYVGTIVDGIKAVAGTARDAITGIRDRFRGFLKPRPSGGASRAETIAAYETGEAHGTGQDIVIRDVSRGGIALEAFWHTMRDGAVEAECAENEAAGWIPADTLFPSGHSRPKAHGGCRCWRMVRIAGFEAAAA